MNEALIFGLIAGALIGAVLVVRGWIQRSGHAAAAGLFVLTGAVAGGLIVLSWGSTVQTRQAIELAELALTLASGVVLLILVARLLRVALPLWLPAMIGAGSFVLLAVVDAYYGGDPVIYAVPIQAGFTIWAWGLFVRSRRAPAVAARRSPASKQRRLALWLLAAMTLANAASLVRLAFADVEWLSSVVPWTLSAMFVALLLGILWSFLDRQASVLAAPADREGFRLVSAAEALIIEERLFADADFKAETVAARLGVAPAELAAALSGSKWGGFAALLQDVRLDRARVMLCEPDEARTSIEAIALLCGFRSRSAFYEGFQRRYGTTPGAYRNKAGSLSAR